MVEPSVRSALEGYKRKLIEMDDEIESIQYYLTRAAPLGSESEMFLDYKSQLQKAVAERGNCVMAARLLQDRLMDLVVSAAEAERAAAAGAALLSPDKGVVETGGEGRAVLSSRRSDVRGNRDGRLIHRCLDSVTPEVLQSQLRL